MAKDEISDRDRCDISRRVYHELDWLNDDTLLEPDTFFASPYHHVRLLFLKYDLENTKNFYITDYKRYIEDDTELSYESLSKQLAKKYRYHWFITSSTREHYNDLLKNIILTDYINASHTIGAFHIIPKYMGYTKCFSYNENAIRTMNEIDVNWEKYRKNYGDISHSEYRNKYFLNKAYKNKLLNLEELELDCSDSWENIFSKMKNITDLINERTVLIINKLNERNKTV